MQMNRQLQQQVWQTILDEHHFEPIWSAQRQLPWEMPL